MQRFGAIKNDIKVLFSGSRLIKPYAQAKTTALEVVRIALKKEEISRNQADKFIALIEKDYGKGGRL